MGFAIDAAATDCTSLKPRPDKKAATWFTPRVAQPKTTWTLGRLFDHVVIVVFENHDYADVVTNPTFRSVAARGVVFDHFVGSFHPSYPNYLAMIGGGYFGTHGDDQRMLPSRYGTIGDAPEAKGLTWTAFAERYPGSCALADASALYQRKHVPFLSFASVTSNPDRCAHVVPFEAFDWTRLPNYAFVTPDMCNDAHNDEDCDGEATQIARWSPSPSTNRSRTRTTTSTRYSSATA